MDEIEKMKKEIGEKIKEKREKMNLSQEQLAEKLGYKSKTSIHKVEQGITDLPQSKIIEFAKVLNTTPAYLMGWTEENHSEDIVQLNVAGLGDIILPNGNIFEFKENNGKIKMLMKEPNKSEWQEFQFDDYEQREFEKVMGMNMLFFNGKEVAAEDKIELEKTLLTIFIKAYFNHKK
nr:MAG TPA: helix-turn-helix domain protein [Caudoviricetes sp.]